ncbi:unnamed protein product (mitochondrion) [Plasmodiophora brassicae]|uniref:Phosphatidate cytidylyltransferase n=1 Tax=Plasmodiophora brassicae TaxID=37360 RepID=A0A0G4IKB5_PLABS|nr:hypothetical protein PBRA_004349 [Plasmodiophora brassicae]SPR00490.1 unnamed protein product [Plasmodiophora brassicae]
MGMNLRSRFLAFGIVAPIALFLLLNASLRIVFGLALSLLASLELKSNLDRGIGCQSSVLMRLIWALFAPGIVFAAVMYGESGLLHATNGAMILICCLYVILQVGHSKTDTTIHLQLLATCFCTWYIGCNIGYAALLNKQQWALDVLIYVIVVIGVGETGALFGGAVFGRHRVSWISPGKTLEGYVAAVLTGVLASLAFDALHGFFFPASKFPLVGSRSIALPCVISIAGSLGDLVESLIKRGLNIKDMGTVLLGWGGLLDRIDGLLFAFPATYYYLAAYYPSAIET